MAEIWGDGVKCPANYAPVKGGSLPDLHAKYESLGKVPSDFPTTGDGEAPGGRGDTDCPGMG